MPRPRENFLWDMEPGDVSTIEIGDGPDQMTKSALLNFKLYSYKIAKMRGVRFKFEPFLDISVDVACVGDEVRVARSKEVLSLGVGESFRILRGQWRSYVNVIKNIEDETDRRFLIKTASKSDPYKYVTRLPDLAEKLDYIIPKSKYGFGEIPVGSYKKYSRRTKQWAVEKSAYEYSMRTEGRFKFETEWRDGDLYVHRVR